MKKLIKMYNEKYGDTLGVIDDDFNKEQMYRIYYFIKNNCEDKDIQERLAKIKLDKPKTLEQQLTKLESENNKVSGKVSNDNAVILPLPIYQTQENDKTITKIVNIMDLIPGVQYSTYKDINQTKTQGYRVVYICDDGTFKIICTLALKNKIVHLLKVVHSTNYSTLSYNNIAYKVDYSKHSTNTDIEITKTLQNYIPIANNIEYTPTREYHPTTKKYVDDKFICTDIVDNVGTISKEEMQKCNNGTSRYVSSINLKEFFADYEHCIYQGTYGDKKIRMKYDAQFNRIIAYDLTDVIMLGFDFGTNHMYPFNAGTDEVKAYQFTNDLVITKSPILNPSEVLTKNNTQEYTPTENYHPSTKKYVDDKIKGDLGTSELNTTAKDIKGAINEVNSQYKDITKNHKNIIYVTNENYKESITKMRDGYIYNIIEDITLNENIKFSNLNNIEFRCDSTIRVSDGFTNNKNVIEFNKCNNVLFECKKIDLENKELFDANGMNFIILFTDCENVNVINTEIINGMGIKGLSSSVNCINSIKVGKNLTVNNLTVNKCRSSVFTQYENNTITNVKAYNSNDAIIALNSENCKNSYISNCYADYNSAFPLVAVENNAINVNIENCIAKNTRGLLEIFSLENSVIDSYEPSLNTVNIANCAHIIDDETFKYNDSVTLVTFSFRRGIEKYTNINIDKVDCFNTTTKGSSYLYISDTNLNGSILNNLSVKNSYVNIKSIKDYAILFNANTENIVLKDNKFINGSNSYSCVRHSIDSIRIDRLTIEGGYIDGFERAFTYDFTYNDFIDSFTMKNTRFINTPAIIYNYPNGTITNNDYNVNMFNSDYILSNKGCSRFSFSRSKQPPTVGLFFKGDIAINTFNDEEYYYNGTKWIKRDIVGGSYIESADNPSDPPTQVNNIYVNTNTRKVYISIGTNSVDDWILLN